MSHYAKLLHINKEIYFMDEKLNRKLYKDLIKLYKRITEFYNPNRFLQMLITYENDGEIIVFKLFKKDIYYGFEELRRMGKLKFSVETLILKDYKDYFPLEVIKKFEKRLKDCGYNPYKKD